MLASPQLLKLISWCSPGSSNQDGAHCVQVAGVRELLTLRQTIYTKTLVFGPLPQAVASATFCPPGLAEAFGS